MYLENLDDGDSKLFYTSKDIALLKGGSHGLYQDMQIELNSGTMMICIM